LKHLHPDDQHTVLHYIDLESHKHQALEKAHDTKQLKKRVLWTTGFFSFIALCSQATFTFVACADSSTPNTCKHMGFDMAATSLVTGSIMGIIYLMKSPMEHIIDTLDQMATIKRATHYQEVL
ncbi:hypothetical protein, partial [Pseudomonas sp. 100_A]|uniref:hypothetical protein n=1 Tax=Pseudomonas sp. 100_A TaxID=2813571 RepID=UPI001A9DDA85